MTESTANGSRMPIMQVIEHGLYENGVKQGVWKIWLSDGSLRKTEVFEDGQPHGATIYYFPNGQEQLREHWQQGQLHGPFMQFFEDGARS